MEFIMRCLSFWKSINISLYVLIKKKKLTSVSMYEMVKQGTLPTSNCIPGVQGSLTLQLSYMFSTISRGYFWHFQLLFQ